MTFGNRLRQKRNNNNYTQIMLAEETNIPQTTISLWERDKGSPDVIELPLLAKALNCTINELIGEEKQK